MGEFEPSGRLSELDFAVNLKLSGPLWDLLGASLKVLQVGFQYFGLYLARRHVFEFKRIAPDFVLPERDRFRLHQLLNICALDIPQNINQRSHLMFEVKVE
jgi:hypothetical protein